MHLINMAVKHVRRVLHATNNTKPVDYGVRLRRMNMNRRFAVTNALFTCIYFAITMYVNHRVPNPYLVLKTFNQALTSHRTKCFMLTRPSATVMENTSNGTRKSQLHRDCELTLQFLTKIYPYVSTVDSAQFWR